MKRLFGTIRTNSLVQGSLIYTGGTFVIGFMNYLFSSLSARILGPAQFGEIAAVFSYIAIASVPLGAMTMTIINRLGATSEGAAESAWRWQGWFFKTTIRNSIFIIPYFLLALILPALTNLSPLSSVALLILFLVTVYATFYTAILQGVHALTLFTILSLTTTALKLGGPVLAQFIPFKLLTVYVFLISSSCIVIIGGYRYLKKNRQHTDTSHPISFSARSLLLKQIVILTMISLIGMQVLNNLDVVIAKKILSPTDAGLYGAWNLFAKIIFYITGPIISLSFIYFSSRKHKKYHARILFISMLCLLMLGVSAYIGYSLFGTFIVTLFLGKHYVPVAKYLGYAGLFGTSYSGIFFLNNYFLSRSSKLAIASTLFIPVYIFLMYLGIHSYQSILFVSTFFSCAIYALYTLLAIYYNIHRWKRKRTPTS
jgi:O-antigen/teichoic acid export membrane protein